MVHSDTSSGSRAVSRWILTGVIMLLIQVILGGITRLTGSGLSITEWNIVTGTLPPLSDTAWLTEFDKYRQTPQYQLLNTRFTLEDFKFIFFWEWLHRFWARLIGIVFVVGFVYLVSKRALKKEMRMPLLLLFLLGAAQGAVGWIMVVSGLTGDEVYVKPTRLALHFIFAMGLIAYAFWFALKLTVPGKNIIQHARIHRSAWWLMGLLIVQLIFGALMAGHKAAMSAPTWPDINGSLVPTGMFRHSPLLLNILDNVITVHFIHRNLAYLLLILIILFTIKLYKLPVKGNVFRRARVMPLVLVAMQLLLGIFSVLSARSIIPNSWGIFEWMAQLHQIVGMLLMLSLVMILYLVRAGNENSVSVTHKGAV